MTLQQLLNADMATIGRLLRQGLSWWGRELAELVPPALRGRQTRAARWLAEVSRQDGSIHLWRNDVLEEVVNTPIAGVRPVDLLLPPGSVLIQELDLPRLSPSDLRRLVALNLDRFTPFSAERVYFDTLPIGMSPGGSKQRIRLGVISRERGRAALAHASALGLKVERIGVGAPPDGRVLEFDFLRAIRMEDGGDPTRRRRAYLWGACAVLLVANVLVALGRDMSDVAQIQQLVDTQQPTVALALRLRTTVSTERTRRVALLTRRAVHEPLRILDAVTRALPRGQWAQRLEWNGRAVRLVGFKKPGFDPLVALRGPALTNPRSLMSDMPTKTATGDEPFDVMADASARVGR